MSIDINSSEAGEILQRAAQAQAKAADEMMPPPRRDDRNNLAYWFPILESTGVPVPRTKIITTDVQLVNLLDGTKPDGYDEFIAELRATCDDIGYPAFLRTGMGSGKHYWSRTCHVPSADVLPRHVWELVEWSECVDFFGLDSSTWVVREMLPLASSFTAFLGDFPVNRERRYFIEGGRVRCRHPYWPIGAVEQGSPKDPAWREKLAALNEETPEEVACLTALSEHVSRSFDGAWSLDWAIDTSGKWWALDMAEAARSFHWEGCPNASTEGKV